MTGIASVAKKTIKDLVPKHLSALAPSKRVDFTLAEVFSPHCAGRRKIAFTLAEVLITLGIIGVVAAITLPSLIHKQRAYVLHKQFLKSYSNISQAVLLMKAENGIDNLRQEYATFDPVYGYPRANDFYNEFDKYMKVVKSVQPYEQRNYIGEKSKNSCAATPYALRVLPDGSSYGRYISGSRITFFLDINGPKKGPNRYGFDIFSFEINNNKDKVTPIKMTKLYTKEELENINTNDESIKELAGNPCSIKSKQDLNGIGCAWYALNDINPDDETKKYWDSLPW